MHIIIDATGTPQLDRPSDFTAFSIKAATTDQQAVVAALAADGAVAAEADHVYVTVDAVRRWARATEPAEEWEAGFAKMLAYAGSKGWMDESGQAIKAHIEVL